MTTPKFGSCAQLETKKLYSNGMYSLDLVFEGKSIFTMTGTKALVDKVRDIALVAHRAGYLGAEMIQVAETEKKGKSVCAVSPIKTEGT